MLNFWTYASDGASLNGGERCEVLGAWYWCLVSAWFYAWVWAG